MSFEFYGHPFLSYTQESWCPVGGLRGYPVYMRMITRCRAVTAD